MKIRLGHGWAPEIEEKNITRFANRELRMLLNKLFSSGCGAKLRGGRNL